MTTYYDIVFYLMENAGRCKPVSGSKLARVFGIDGFAVRTIINKGRTDGMPICATREGYYIAEESGDILENITSMEHRMKSMQKAVDGLKEAYARASIAEDMNG